MPRTSASGHTPVGSAAVLARRGCETHSGSGTRVCVRVCVCDAERRVIRTRSPVAKRAAFLVHLALRRGLAAAARLAAALGRRLPELLRQLRGLVLGKQPVLHKPSLRHLALGPLLVQALVEEGEGVRLKAKGGAVPELGMRTPRADAVRGPGHLGLSPAGGSRRQRS
eukprot:4926828-Prymnesium_polylepis.1